MRVPLPMERLKAMAIVFLVYLEQPTLVNFTVEKCMDKEYCNTPMENSMKEHGLKATKKVQYKKIVYRHTQFYM